MITSVEQLVHHIGVHHNIDGMDEGRLRLIVSNFLNSLSQNEIIAIINSAGRKPKRGDFNNHVTVVELFFEKVGREGNGDT